MLPGTLFGVMMTTLLVANIIINMSIILILSSLNQPNLSNRLHPLLIIITLWRRRRHLV